MWNVIKCFGNYFIVFAIHQKSISPRAQLNQSNESVWWQFRWIAMSAIESKQLLDYYLSRDFSFGLFNVQWPLQMVWFRNFDSIIIITENQNLKQSGAYPFGMRHVIYIYLIIIIIQMLAPEYIANEIRKSKWWCSFIYVIQCKLLFFLNFNLFLIRSRMKLLSVSCQTEECQ